MEIGRVFLVGAAKAGTTSLYQVLSRHPEICSPLVKEPNFYSYERPGKGPGDNGTVWTTGMKQYQSLYRVGANHRQLIDGSVSYLYSPLAPGRIRSHFPDAKVIIILRNPVDRAWSHYKHLIRDGRERLSFEEALALEAVRVSKGWEFSWHLRSMGMYSAQVDRYFQYFGKSQVRVFLFEELQCNFGEVVRAATDFIGLRPFEMDPEPERDNQSGRSRSRRLARMVNWAAGYKVFINKLVGPSVTHSVMQKFRALNVREGNWSFRPETRQELKDWFRADIGKTGQLIGRDLSAWQ
ncbi:MAG: sulfotransferase [Solitalea sp.]